jgi:hypothetical protein
MKTVFFTHVSDDWFDPIGAAKFIASAAYTHADIPLVVFKSVDINAEFAADASLNWNNLIPVFGQKLCDKYDLVVHFDADSVILSRLDELLACDYDVAGTLDIVHWEKKYPVYLNCGLVAASCPDFWAEWRKLNYAFADHLPHYEQDVWNYLFHCGKYRGKVLDDQNCFYGLSSDVHGNNKENGKNVELRRDGIYIRGRKIKVIHHATGHTLPKLDLHNWFDPRIYQYLESIIR